MVMTIIFKQFFPDDKVYKVYINNDPGLTLTYFTARSNLVKVAHCASDQ